MPVTNSSVPSPEAPETDGAHSLYTKAGLAQYFQVPESTIRYYCSRFAPFLPGKGEGRRRRYEASCLEVLAFIREAMPRARTSRAMERLLEERFPRHETRTAAEHEEYSLSARFERCDMPENFPIPATSPQNGDKDAAGRVLHMLEQQSEALDRIASALGLLAGREQEAAVLREQAGRTEKELENMRRELQALRALVISAEKTQQDDLEQLRTWLGRLAKEIK